MLNRFRHHAALLTGALLMCASIGSFADDVADANQLLKQGQPTQALEKVNGYLSAKPQDAQARFLKGRILAELGKPAEAINIFSALTHDYPSLPEPYNNLAVLYADQGQYEKARQTLELAMRTQPSYATAHENLSGIYAKMASQAYDRALQMDRGNAPAQTKLTMIQDLTIVGARTREPATKNNVAPARVAVATASQTASAAAPQPPATQPAANLPPAKIVAATASPVPAAPPANPPSVKDNNDEVVKTINDWAAAWSSKNAGKYLSYYARDFKTPDGMARADWEAMRRERIGKPKHIEVSVKILAVQFTDDDHATAKFRQTYRASYTKTSNAKNLSMLRTISMARHGNKWLIQGEGEK